MSNIQIKPKIKSKIVSQFIFLHDKRRRRSAAPKSIFLCFVEHSKSRDLAHRDGKHDCTRIRVRARAGHYRAHDVRFLLLTRATMRITSFFFCYRYAEELFRSRARWCPCRGAQCRPSRAPRRVHDGVRAPSLAIATISSYEKIEFGRVSGILPPVVEICQDFSSSNAFYGHSPCDAVTRHADIQRAAQPVHIFSRLFFACN